jgi:hypothetical protein
MGLRPAQGDENVSVQLLPFMEPTPFPLSSRPGFPATLHWTRSRVRLSLKERRMRSVNATKFHRKSGGAKPRDLQFRGPFLEMFFDRTQRRDLRFLFSSRRPFSARHG